MKKMESKVFGKWTVLQTSEKDSRKYDCICICGSIYSVSKSNLISGKTKGCMHCRFKGNGRVSVCSHRLYLTWKSMKTRCYNKNTTSYKYYGGRGITVCDRWKNSFQNFVADLFDSFEEGKTLDRIDGDGNYEPNNCRWATSIEQGKNKKTSLSIIYKGQEYTEAELSRVTGVKRTTIQQRRRSGYIGDELIIGKPSKKPIYNGKEYTIIALAKMFGIKPLTLAYRLRVGYSVIEALNYKR